MDDSEYFGKKIFFDFLKKNSKFSKSPKNFNWEIFEFFLKTIPLYVSDDADNFKPIIYFFDFGQLTQLANWLLIDPSVNFFREKVVPLFISYTVVKVRSLSDLQEARTSLITGCSIENLLKINQRPIKGHLIKIEIE